MLKELHKEYSTDQDQNRQRKLKGVDFIRNLTRRGIIGNIMQQSDFNFFAV